MFNHTSTAMKIGLVIVFLFTLFVIEANAHEPTDQQIEEYLDQQEGTYYPLDSWTEDEEYIEVHEA